MELQQKLIQACSSLGLNLLEISKFVQINDYPKIACWGYDMERKESRIYINPRILRFPVEQIQLILKHEILHYAGYKNIEHAYDFDKANIALDIVINKILTVAYEKEMKNLCRKIYTEESKRNVLCLARPDINPDETGAFQKNWLNIWSKQNIPSPSSIYYQIAAPTNLDNPFAVKVIVQVNILFRRLPECKINDQIDKVASEIIKELLNHVENRGFSRTEFAKTFNEIFVHKKAFDCNSVEEFILKLETRQKLEETCDKLVSALDNRSSCLVYPYELSRLGIVYFACGISDKIPIFWNKTPESRKNKIAIYIDTSPSMECYKEKEVFLIDRLKSYFPTKVYCFANDVEETTLDDFTRGNYKNGYSTSFDKVIKHLIDSKFDAGIIFTDGYSSVDSKNRVSFVQSKKRLFTVYFSDGSNINSDLDEISEQTLTIKAD